MQPVSRPVEQPFLGFKTVKRVQKTVMKWQINWGQSCTDTQRDKHIDKQKGFIFHISSCCGTAILGPYLQSVISGPAYDSINANPEFQVWGSGV